MLYVIHVQHQYMKELFISYIPNYITQISSYARNP